MQRIKKVNQYIILFSILYLLPFTIDYIYVLNTRILQGDLSRFNLKTNLDNISLTYVYIRGIIYYILGYVFFRMFQRHNFVTQYFIKINRKRFEYLLISFMLLQIYFAINFKIGAAGGHSGNKLSSLMNLCNFSLFFPLYYFEYREKINKKFCIIYILYILLNIMQGWTGFVISLVYMELFYRIIKKKLSVIILLFFPLIFFVGALLYKYMYPLKTLIRYGHYSYITYLQSLVKLITRFSCYSNTCVAFEKQDIMLLLNGKYSVPHAELICFFNTITPSFLYDKNFYILNQLFMKAGINETYGVANFDLGTMYYYLLIRVSVIDFILYFVFLVISTIGNRFFFEFIAPKSIFIDYTFCTFYSYTFLIGGALNGKSIWINMIYPLFMFIILKCFKFLRRRKNYDICLHSNI